MSRGCRATPPPPTLPKKKLSHSSCRLMQDVASRFPSENGLQYLGRVTATLSCVGLRYATKLWETTFCQSASFPALVSQIHSFLGIYNKPPISKSITQRGEELISTLESEDQKPDHCSIDCYLLVTSAGPFSRALPL